MTRISCTRTFAETVFNSANPDRAVFRCKDGGSRWTAVEKAEDIVDGYEYAVSAIIDDAAVKKMLQLSAEIKAKQEELDAFKQSLNSDAAIYRSKHPRNTYKVTLGNDSVSSTTSDKVTVFAGNTLKEKLGKAFDDIFDTKPVSYEVKDSLKSAVVAALNGDLIYATSVEFLQGLTADWHNLSMLMRPTIRANAYVFKEQLCVDWDTAMEWATDYQYCHYYELLNTMAELNGMDIDQLVQTLAMALEVKSSNRVNITTKEG